MWAKKQQSKLDMEKYTGSKLGKEYVKAVYCHPAFLTSLQSTSWNSGLYEAQSGIKIAGRNINNLKYADDTTLMAESKEALKEPLDEGKRGEWKAGLKQHSKNEDHGIQSHHFMLNRWGKNENRDRLYFPGLQNRCKKWLQP